MDCDVHVVIDDRSSNEAAPEIFGAAEPAVEEVKRWVELSYVAATPLTFYCWRLAPRRLPLYIDRHEAS